MGGHGVHVICIAEVDGGRAIGGWVEAIEHLSRSAPPLDGHLDDERRLRVLAPKTMKGVVGKKNIVAQGLAP